MGLKELLHALKAKVTSTKHSVIAFGSGQHLEQPLDPPILKPCVFGMVNCDHIVSIPEVR